MQLLVGVSTIYEHKHIELLTNQVIDIKPLYAEINSIRTIQIA